MFVREGPITIRRRPKAQIDQDTGKYITPKETEFTVSGSLQPVLGEDLAKLPAGFRVYDAKTLFLHESMEENDKVIHGGEEYIVEHKEFWEPPFSPIPHYRYILTKEVAR